MVDPVNTKTAVAGLQCEPRSVVGDELESGKETDAQSLMSHGREFEFYF